MFKKQFELCPERVKAILFDFDGVLVESVRVKTDAFAELFKDFPAPAKAKAMEFHLRNGGVSRHRKIRFAYEEALGSPISDSEIDRLAELFGELSHQKVIEAPAVPGSLKFLQENHGRFTFFVISGTPESELKATIEKRGLTHFFKEVLGAPILKADHIRGVLKRHGLRPEETIFVGDSITDFDAATEVGITFVSVV